MPTNPTPIAELRRLLEKATPGPWRKSSAQNWATIAVIPHTLIGTPGPPDTGTRLCDVDSVARLMGANNETNAALICALVNNAEWLLDAAAEAATLRARVAELEAALRPFALRYPSTLGCGVTDDDWVSYGSGAKVGAYRRAAAILKASRADEG